MLLQIKRSQKDGGVLAGGKLVFVLNAQVSLSPAEDSLIKRLGLSDLMVYTSEASQRHAAAATAPRPGQDHPDWDIGSRVMGKITSAASAAVMSMGHAALARMNLNIKVSDLIKGIRIEAKALDEAIAIENAIGEACQTMSLYLKTAATFNGEVQTYRFDDQAPQAIEPPSVQAPQPVPAPPPVQAIQPRERSTPGPEARPLFAPEPAPVQEPLFAPKPRAHDVLKPIQFDD